MANQEKTSLFYRHFGFEVIRHRLSSDDFLAIIGDASPSEATGKINLMEEVKKKFLSREDVVSPNLADIVIVDTDLTNIDFSGCIVRGARFNNCNLSYSVFRDLDMSDVIFFDCVMNGVDLRGSDVSDLTFSGYGDNWMSKAERSKKLAGIKLSSNKILVEKYLKENARLVQSAKERAHLDHEEQITQIGFKIKSLEKSQSLLERLITLLTKKSANSELDDLKKQLKNLKEHTPIIDSENIIISETMEFVLEAGAKFDPAYQLGSALEGVDLNNIYVRITRKNLEEFLQAGHTRYSSLVDFAKEKFEQAGGELAAGEQIIPDLSIYKDKEGKTVKINLSGVNFDGVDISRANLLGCNMKGCSINRAVLDYTVFEGACLDEATISSSTGEGINLVSIQADDLKISLCQFDAAHLNNAEISNAKITDSSLKYSIASNAVITKSEFKKVDMKNSNFHRGKLRKNIFEEVNLVRSKLDDVSFKGSTFLKSDLSYSSLARSNFSRCKFRDCGFMHTNMLSAKLDDILAKGRIDFTGAFLAKSSFLRARGEWYIMNKARGFLTDATAIKVMHLEMKNANFAFSSMQNSQFKKLEANGAELSGVNFANSKFIESSFLGAFMNDVHGESIVAKKAQLSSVEMHGASFIGADLEGAKLKKSDMRNCLFSGANLNDSNFDGAFINYATDFSDAKIVNAEGALQFAEQKKQTRIADFKKECDNVGISKPTSGADWAREQLLGILHKALESIGNFFIKPISPLFVSMLLILASGVLSIDFFVAKFGDGEGWQTILHVAGSSAVVVVIVQIITLLAMKHIQNLTVGINKVMGIILFFFYGMPGLLVGLLLGFSGNRMIHHFKEKDLNEYLSVIFLQLASSCTYLAKGLSLNKKYKEFVKNRLDDIKAYKRSSRIKYRSKKSEDVVDVAELTFRRLVAKAGLEEETAQREEINEE